ncbi:hypothetical protein [Alloactinosynnema sp. L-07]|uniref:hypothetical protein n=1 Tax=Alloactinosynnema sp. L-07 TaxID=1653480 RepID=UPI00065EF7DC|nr:hypothetical protein [Alloactinosynnema sp. L-07]CRK55447.1 hypothetical protein [Alloactinosynnema sp. L-07]
MDPNAALTQIRDLCKDNPDEDFHEFDMLKELITGLDRWLSSGGFLPEPWTR